MTIGAPQRDVQQASATIGQGIIDLAAVELVEHEPDLDRIVDVRQATNPLGKLLFVPVVGCLTQVRIGEQARP